MDSELCNKADVASNTAPVDDVALDTDRCKKSNRKYLSTVQLSTPYQIYRVNLGGLVVVNCIKGNGTLFTGQLLIDYMSDSVLNYDTGIHGKPLVSPDSQVLLTIDASLGRIFIQKVVGKG